MSIIYDALNKTQSQRDKVTSQLVTPKAIKRPNMWFRLVIIPLFLFLSVLMAYIAYQDLMVSKPKSVAAVQAPQQKLELNGVFLAGNDKYAMINQQPYKLGDSVDSRKIVSIDMNAVKLRDANKGLTTLKIAL